MDENYLDNLYNELKSNPKFDFRLDQETFNDKMLNDTNYRDKVYTNVKMFSSNNEFKVDPNTFYTRVLESSKKKSQSEIGSQTTQPGSGSENAQYAFEPGMQEQPTFQGVGKAIEKNLGVKTQSDQDIQAPLTEEGVKELEYRKRIEADKDKYKLASDEQIDEAIRRNPEIASSDKFYEGAVPEIEGIPTTLFGSKTKLEAAQKERDYLQNWDADFEAAPKQTDLFSDDDIKSDPKKYQEAALNDYLEYLKSKNGEDSQTYLGTKEKIDYYKSLGDKLYTDGEYADDLRRFQDIQKTALSKIGNNSYAKALKIQNSYDWDYFSKRASDLELKAQTIQKQINELGVSQGKVLSAPQQKKYEDLLNQYNNIQTEFSKLSEDTKIDNNVILEMNNIQKKMSNVRDNLIKIEDEDTPNAKRVKEYKQELEANKKAQEEFYNTKDSGVLETTGKAVSMIGQKTASSFVSGVFSMYNLPKIAGEAMGVKGYGWTDKMSEAADNINSYVDLYSPQLESGNLTNFMSSMSSLGEGLGSVLTFYTGGSSVSGLAKGLNLSQKSLNIANKAGQFAVASSLSTSQMYDEFLNNGFTPEQASRYALGAGIVMGAAEMIVPEDELLANQLKGSFLSAVKSGATTKEAIENGLKFLATKSYQIAETASKEYTEETIGQLAESSSKQVASAMTGNKIDGIWNVDDFTKSGLAGGGVGGLIELFKFGSKTGKYSNPFEENMVGYLAENYDDMIKKLSESNPEAYDQIADRYGKLKEIYNGLKNTPAFNQLSKADQDHILAQAHTKQVILENIKQSGLDKATFSDQIASIDEDIFLTLNKPKENAVQESSTEEVLPREQGTATETGGQPQGMGQGVQGEEVAQQGETEAQRQERIAEEASAGAAEVVTELNMPNALAASVFPVVGEVEAQIEKGEFVNDEKSTEAQDKLYELLADIDSREDLTPEQKQQMSAVIENRIQKIQDYDYRTRTETRTTTQTVATGVSPKTQKQNERAAIPVRTVSEEGIEVTYDGRRGKVELRNGEYVFIPAKTGAVQGKPVVIGEAAQVNANSRFAGVENPTKGPNAVVANITLPNGSTMSVLNDDLSVDIGLEIAKQEVGAAPQALFDTVFEEIVTENKVEVPYLRETKPAQEQAATTEQVAEQPAPQVTPQVQSNEFTGTSKRDLELKRKYAKDAKKRRVLEQATRVASVLKGKVKIILHENSNDYKNARTNLTGTAPLDSEAGSFNYSEDGEIQEIHIDLSQATDSTIFHEAAHAVLFNAFGENKELFQKFKDKLKPLLANSTVEQLEQFANNPNYVSQGVTAEEFLAEFSGLMASQGKSLPKSTLQKIAQLINDFVSTITGGKLKPFQNTADTAQVIDFFNSMFNSFASGQNIESLMDSKGLIGSGQVNGNVKSKQSINTKLPEQQERTANFSKVKSIKLSELNDKTGVLTGSDRLTTATLKLPDGTTMNLKGGIFYPSETGLVWAATIMTRATELAKKINEVIEQQGEAWLFPVNNAYGSQISNYTFFEIGMRHLQDAVKKRTVTKDEIINKINQFKKRKNYLDNFKKGYTPKTFSQSLANKNLQQIYDLMHDDFLPENATYDGRKEFIKTFFGGEETESRVFENVPNTAELIAMTTEPVNAGVRDFTTSSVIRITGKVTPKETSKENDGELFHSSYPAIIESSGNVESYVLDGTYNIEEVFPEFQYANGEVGSWESIKEKIAETGKEATYKNYRNAIIAAQGSIPRAAKIKAKSQQNLVKKAGISSNMTEDDQGNYLFYHYSPNKISSIDPRFFGRNVNRTGRDERPGMNISMYYTSPDVKDVSGDFGYVVRIPKDKVYPFNKDPLDLYDKAKEAFNKKFPGQAFDPNKQVAFISAEAAKLGYPMTVAKWGDNLRAQTTQKMVGEVYTKPAKGGGIDVNEDIAQFKVNKKARRSKLKSKSQIGKYDALPGAPKSGPIKELVDVAENYAKKFNIPYTRQAEYVQVDEDFAKRIADAYAEMKHDPSNPKVKEAYSNLIQQTKDQYNALIDAGYEFSFFDSNTDPYDENPMEAMRDLRNNKKMAVYGTYDGYGTEGITGASIEDNPMLENTGLQWVDQNGVMHDVTANDLFRAVHDAFGHGLEGAGFRARGEENAWQAHARLFTGSAVAAITTETRGQNSWLNFGPFGEKNRTAKLKDTIFAEQKTGLMPEWTWTENVAPAMSETEIKSKSQVSAIPSSKAEQKEVISEMETAMSKTGLAKENAVKRFIEKYGEKGVVAKQINDNFDKIQEQLGITKICNI